MEYYPAGKNELYFLKWTALQEVLLSEKEYDTIFGRGDHIPPQKPYAIWLI